MEMDPTNPANNNRPQPEGHADAPLSNAHAELAPLVSGPTDNYEISARDSFYVECRYAIRLSAPPPSDREARSRAEFFNLSLSAAMNTYENLVTALLSGDTSKRSDETERSIRSSLLLIAYSGWTGEGAERSDQAVESALKSAALELSIP
jgi:hypothetical protein